MRLIRLISRRGKKKKHTDTNGEKLQNLTGNSPKTQTHHRKENCSGKINGVGDAAVMAAAHAGALLTSRRYELGSHRPVLCVCVFHLHIKTTETQKTNEKEILKYCNNKKKWVEKLWTKGKSEGRQWI